MEFLKLCAALVFLSLFTPLRGEPSAIDEELSQTKLSAEIVRLRDGKDLLSLDPKQALVAASVTKVLLTASLTEAFALDERFSTKIYHTGRLKDGSISGDVYIVGSGDPYLVSEDLFLIATRFRSLGIKKILGHVYIDNSLFDDVAFDKSRLTDSESTSFAYKAPITAFAINFNAHAVRIVPGDQLGFPALVTLDPFDLEGVPLLNRVLTVKGVSQFSVDTMLVNSKEMIQAKGNINLVAKPQIIYRSVKDPVLVSGEMFRAALLQQGIRTKNKVKEGLLPKGAKLLLEYKGKTVFDMIKGLHLYSNNYMADTLFKKLGSVGGKQGSFSTGEGAVKAFLKKIGVDGVGSLRNGSGLSSETRLSARQLVSVLAYMAKDFRVFPEYLASFAQVGSEGTLLKRFKQIDGDWFVKDLRAKTGSLSKPFPVASLAGYFHHPKHGLCAFAWIQNGSPKQRRWSLKTLRKSQDRSLSKMLQTL